VRERLEELQWSESIDIELTSHERTWDEN